MLHKIDNILKCCNLEEENYVAKLVMLVTFPNVVAMLHNVCNDAANVSQLLDSKTTSPGLEEVVPASDIIRRRSVGVHRVLVEVARI